MTRAERMKVVRAERASTYERLALELFAEQGFPNVTVEQVAAAAGVSTRTFFRYFRTKEDILLTLPRRHARGLIGALQQLEPSDDPVAAVWTLLVDLSRELPEGVEELSLWYRASALAPEVQARAAGERSEVIEALTEYCARSLHVDPSRDIRPSVLAAALHGAERAVLGFWKEHGESTDLSRLFAEGMDSLRTIGGNPRRLRAVRSAR